jgi:glycosyltransferase involved in cell wall biosynthesis
MERRNILPNLPNIPRSPRKTAPCPPAPQALCSAPPVRVAFVVPAYQAAHSVARVVAELREAARGAIETTEPAVVVVDDGSTDDTAQCATEAGALVVRHGHNRGKGAALLTGFARAVALGADVAVSVDADGQHLAEEAVRVAQHGAGREALVLAVRDLRRDGAPRANRFSNGFSNLWMSWFAGRALRDTQCGLRRYPLPEVLDLGLQGSGYELEAEVILKAARARWPIHELPARVFYPPGKERVSHFHSVRDPARIVFRILKTAATMRFRPRTPA